MKYLKIKWENITLMIFGTFFVICVISHFIRNGFDFNIFMFEVFIYGLVLTINYVAISNARKVFLNK